MKQTFLTFQASMDYSVAITQSNEIVASKVWEDRFKMYRPNTIIGKLLGFSAKAVNDCTRLAPGGTWEIIADERAEIPLRS